MQSLKPARRVPVAEKTQLAWLMVDRRLSGQGGENADLMHSASIWSFGSTSLAPLAALF